MFCKLALSSLLEDNQNNCPTSQTVCTRGNTGSGLGQKETVCARGDTGSGLGQKETEYPLFEVLHLSSIVREPLSKI